MGFFVDNLLAERQFYEKPKVVDYIQVTITDTTEPVIPQTLNYWAILPPMSITQKKRMHERKQWRKVRRFFTAMTVVISICAVAALGIYLLIDGPTLSSYQCSNTIWGCMLDYFYDFQDKAEQGLWFIGLSFLALFLNNLRISAKERTNSV